MIKQYKKKPIPVEVIQFTGKPANINEICDWSNGTIKYSYTEETMYIHTLEGTMRPSVEDYVIKGPAGEFWFVRKEIFEATYEEI